jgi:hypothetical protein
MDQAVPFHCSSSAPPDADASYPPAAKQVVAVGHDTPSSSVSIELFGLGTVTSDQLVPSQCSAMGLAVNTVALFGEFDAYPTAKQFVALEQDTPLSVTVVAPAGVGLATIDHVVPFHCSISVVDVSVVREAAAASPTATQLVGLEHDTPSSSTNGSFRGVGLATIDQPVPFQRSINEPFASEPTAKHSDGLEHDTADN